MRLGIASTRVSAGGAGTVLGPCGLYEAEAKQSIAWRGCCMSCRDEPCAQIAIAKKDVRG